MQIDDGRTLVDRDAAVAIAFDDEFIAGVDLADACPPPPVPTLGETMEQLVETLGSAPPADAMNDALAVIVRAAGAIGAGLAEWTGRGEPSVLASCGPIAATSTDLDICRFFIDAVRRRDRAFCKTTLIEKDLRYACAALGRRGQDLLGLVMWGDGSARLDDPALVRVFLRLVDPLRAPRAPRAAAVDDLPPRDEQFPSSYVPMRSHAMAETYRQMRIVAPANFPLLVLGETGVGKEHVVRILHSWSRRKRGPFIAVNCAAIPETLLEAELFGIGRGVASGVHEREGKFQLAEGGTLFLDEIGELPLPMQAKLLRVLQSQEITPVGSRPIHVDVRIVAATNADLPEKMRAGQFRPDLYYRIAGTTLQVPPLRECRGDIARLVEHFLRTFVRELDRPIRGLSVRGLEMLVQHSWPGNVRELEHAVRRLVYNCAPGGLIDSVLLSERVVLEERRETSVAGSLDLQTHVDCLERDLIRQALQRARGNRSSAARLLGLSRNGLALKMARLGFS